jgi:hypothetical protein
MSIACASTRGEYDNDKLNLSSKDLSLNCFFFFLFLINLFILLGIVMSDHQLTRKENEINKNTIFYNVYISQEK